MGYYGFPEYVPVAEKKAKAQKSLEKLRKQNPDICPVIINGRNLANTWWGKAWNKNLESYSDYSNRLERGRSYARHGSVLDLKIMAGKILALVQGSGRKPYQVEISIQVLNEPIWKQITTQCLGKIDSLQELLEGKFPKALVELFTTPGKGLFPTPKEIKFNCSCPDYASMCKHVAAVLYGVGARLDENPALFFLLRDVSLDELISKAIIEKSEILLEKSTQMSSRVIGDEDLGAIFGIDLENVDDEMIIKYKTEKNIKAIKNKKTK